MTEVRRTSSIARRISWSWFFRSLSMLLLLDILVVALAAAGILYAFERETLGDAWTPQLQRSAQWDADALPVSIEYLVTDASGQTHSYPIGKVAQNAAPFFYILLGFEAVLLLPSLFTGKRKAQRILGPLNRMARETRELSRAAETLERFHSLEDAIGKISPNRPEERLSTGSRELKGLEDAINSLLLRMHESYRQQAQFVSDASHELRTPIAVIQGYAGMLDRWGKQDEKVLEESISAIKSESEYMNRLVEQLLFLARGEMGRNPVQMQPVSLSDLAREVCDESAMIDNAHTWKCNAPYDVRVTADPAMLKQCVRILCDNARKYTPPDGEISIRAMLEDGEGCLSVQDTGIGISEAELPRIFDRFYRSDPARARENGGTGLGLSIAKWIVDRHGGHFRVLSREGLGTRITICLPIENT